jgi:hypothetical protein
MREGMTVSAPDGPVDTELCSDTPYWGVTPGEVAGRLSGGHVSAT